MCDLHVNRMRHHLNAMCLLKKNEQATSAPEYQACAISMNLHLWGTEPGQPVSKKIFQHK